MEITNNRCYTPVSYQGINRRVSKGIYHREYILYFLEKFPKANGIAGNIPSEWVKNMPVENRGENIKHFYATMGIFVSKVLPILSDSKLSSILLTQIMRKYGAIAKDASVDIEYIGSGSFGKGYKLTNKKDGTSLFLKRFPNTKQDLQTDLFERHGIFSETNTKLFLKKHLKTNEERRHFPKFYYSDMYNDYYIEEYLNPKDYIRSNEIFETKKQKEALNEVHKILSNHNLNHSDLKGHNVKFYEDKSKNLHAVCFDLGGVCNN